MFKKSSLDGCSDEDMIKTLRQRLRKLCVSPAEALSECMQVPAVANAGCDGSTVPLVDADVVKAFAEQLQLSVEEPRTLKFLSGIDASGQGTAVSVSDFLNALQGSQSLTSRSRDSRPGPGDTIPAASSTAGLSGPHAAAAAREERKRELMQQSKPKECLALVFWIWFWAPTTSDGVSCVHIYI